METLKADSYTLALELRQMSEDLFSENSAKASLLYEASNRLADLQGDNTHLTSQNNKLKSEITKLKSNGS